MTTPPGMVVVGAGAAGISAARTLRHLGYDGDLTVLAAEDADPYERPSLTKAFLTDPGRDAPPPLIETNILCEEGIALELDTPVVGVDPGTRTVSTGRGRQVPYERLLLATGARCRRLAVPGVDLQGVEYLRDLADARRLRERLRPGRRVVVVGGGVIGMEVAASAATRGCRVTVVEVAPALLGRLVPEGIADVVANVHRARGVRLLTGSRPYAFLGDDQVRAVALTNACLLPADVVVVGVGVQPRVELAADAGLDVGDGVVVDEHFQSSDPHIYAAGDVASVFHADERRYVRTESWKSAQVQGAAAAASMLGQGDPYRDIPWMWSDQYDLHIQAIGFGASAAEAEFVPRGALDDRTGLTYFAVRRDKLVGACGTSVGPGVGKTIRIAQLLMERGHPVAAEALGDPQLDLKTLLRSLQKPRVAADTDLQTPVHLTSEPGQVLPSPMP